MKTKPGWQLFTWFAECLSPTVEYCSGEKRLLSRVVSDNAPGCPGAVMSWKCTDRQNIFIPVNKLTLVHEQ